MSVLRANGAAVHYEAEGSGPPVMLLAGTGYSGGTWHPRLRAALAARYTLITFDYRGTGASSSAGDEHGDYTTKLFAADAAAVIRAVGAGPAHLIGHSMGGRVAQEVYFADPGAVRSLTLAASGAGPALEVPFAQVGIPVGAVRGLLHSGYEKYIRDKHRSNFFTETFAREHPDEVEWLDKAYLSGAPSVDDYLRHVRARQAHTAVARLPSVKIPAYIVVGTADTADGGTGSHLQGAHTLRRLLPHARFELIEGARHGFMWENPEESAARFSSFIDAADG